MWAQLAKAIPEASVLCAMRPTGWFAVAAHNPADVANAAEVPVM